MKREQAVDVSGREVLFTSHDAARESPARRLFYKGDLQGCIFTGRHLETNVAVAL